MYPMKTKRKNSVKQAGEQLKPDRSSGQTDLAPQRDKVHKFKLFTDEKYIDFNNDSYFLSDCCSGM